jgi:hypothetical protein
MFRAEVIGSMLRPSYLKDARAAFEQGELSAQDFRRLEDRAVDQVIAMQEGTGVDVVTDGEMRRFLCSWARSPRRSRGSSSSSTTARCHGARRRATSSGSRRRP